jgi:cystathionine beta-lyase
MPDRTTYDFDKPIDRRNSDSHKWNHYAPDVLPLWLSDMDFISPAPVIEALQERVSHGIFGYPLHPPEELCGLIIDRMERRYGWKISQENFIFLPGTHDGFKLAYRMIGEPGDAVLMHTPLYAPLLKATAPADRTLQTTELERNQDGYYEIDFEEFQETITAQTGLFLLCNPHNPVGRVYNQQELEKIAEICLQNDLVICSDDVHCDLVFKDNHYTPIASLDPEIAQQTITLIAPSKTYNVAGLKLSMAIIPNRSIWQKFRGQLDNYPSAGLGITGAVAAYRDGDNWYRQMMVYLKANRDFLVDYVHNYLPGIRIYPPEGTYLAWLDCCEAELGPTPFQFFLEQARVALGDGAKFGAGGKGFVRLNFACPRQILEEALERMRTAVTQN